MLNFDNQNPTIIAVIPAGGKGLRMQSNIAKQYLQLFGKTVIEHSINHFLEDSRISKIVVAIAKDDEIFRTLNFSKNKKIITAKGGATRAESVFNALQLIEDDAFVVIHDAVRPCLLKDDLEKLLQNLEAQGVILATAVENTIKKVQQNQIINTVNRANLWQALTPQLFSAQLLKNALNQVLQNKQQITDCAEAMELAGYTPQIIQGSKTNIKITTAEDLTLAEFYLKGVNV